MEDSIVGVSQYPSHLTAWERAKKNVVNNNGGQGYIRAILWSPPVNEFSFGDRKGDPQVGTLSLDDVKKVVKGADIGTY